MTATNRTSPTRLTPQEAADRARVSRSLIYALLRRGRLPAMRVGVNGRGKWVIDAGDLEEFLASCEIAGMPGEHDRPGDPGVRRGVGEGVAGGR